MPQDSHRRSPILLIVLLLLVLIALLLLARCPKTDAPTAPPPPDAAVPASDAGPAQAPAAAPTAAEPAEILTPATVAGPATVDAGSAFTVTWTGPDNPHDFITLVRSGAPDNAVAASRNTSEGASLELTAPVEPGEWELRYVAGRSRTVLGRAAVTIAPVGATLDADAEVVLGAKLSVRWTGPNNPGDYITLVARDTPDGRIGNYTETAEGSPLLVTAPPEAGEAELRYMTGQGRRILGRRPVRIVMPEVGLAAPAQANAGATISVTWTGPDNPGDYLTVVERDRPDGQVGNYQNTSTGSPTSLLLPMWAGEAELRYMTGQGRKVLGRRPIRIVMPEASLTAAAQANAGATISVTWTGPDYPGDYITVVERDRPDGQVGNYQNTSAGSPTSLLLPLWAGEAELRYMTGQGRRVLARHPITLQPVTATLGAPSSARAGAPISVAWTGPDYTGDYITIVPAGAPDGEYRSYQNTTAGSPLSLTAPAAAGEYELRYMTGQSRQVLGRRTIRIEP